MHITLNGCKLFFEVYGSKLRILQDRVEEKPTLIVLHGAHGMVDHTLYVPFWSQFSDIAQVIFLDQRGCGRSNLREASEWNLEHWAKDLHGFCEALEIIKPIIAGVSMGGHVMCEYICHYPDQPSALIFCNTEANFVLKDVCDVMEKKGGKEAADLVRLQFTHPTPAIQKAYQTKCVPHYGKKGYTHEQILRCQQRPEIFNHYCEKELLEFNYLNELHKIQVPTLLMAGAESPLHPPVRALEMAERISPGLVTIHMLKEAGAPVYNDSPAEAEKVVQGFIQMIDCKKQGEVGCKR